MLPSPHLLCNNTPGHQADIGFEIGQRESGFYSGRTDRRTKPPSTVLVYRLPSTHLLCYNTLGHQADIGKNLENMFKINRIFGKSDNFLENISHTVEKKSFYKN